MIDIKENLQKVLGNINTTNVTLVAVTKAVDSSRIKDAIDAGIKNIGEIKTKRTW